MQGLMSELCPQGAAWKVPAGRDSLTSRGRLHIALVGQTWQGWEASTLKYPESHLMRRVVCQP